MSEVKEGILLGKEGEVISPGPKQQSTPFSGGFSGSVFKLSPIAMIPALIIAPLVIGLFLVLLVPLLVIGLLFGRKVFKVGVLKR